MARNLYCNACEVDMDYNEEFAEYTCNCTTIFEGEELPDNIVDQDEHLDPESQEDYDEEMWED